MSSTMAPQHPHSDQPDTPGRARLSILPWLTIVAVACTMLAFGRFFPSIPGITLIIESLLPWSILPLILLTVLSLGTRRPTIISLTLIPILIWACLFGPKIIGAEGTLAALSAQDSQAGGDPGTSSTNAGHGTNMRIVSNNVGGAQNDPELTNEAITSARADVVTLQELESDPGRRLRSDLDRAYPYSNQLASLGLWSKWPVTEPEEIELDSRFVRAFRTTMTVGESTIGYYVVHVPSVRPGMEEARNRALRILTEAVRSDDAEKIIVSGDFNTASTDRNFAPLAQVLTDTAEVDPGLNFTWPSAFPLMRLDRIMVSGLTPRSGETINTGGSDHRIVLAEVATG